jgi:tight adherence protein C
MFSPLEFIIEAFTFGIVVAATFATMRAIEGGAIVRRRLGETAAASGGDGSVIRSQGVANPILAWVQASSSLSNEKDRNKLRRDLAMAGFDHPAAPVWYIIIRFALAIGCPLLFLFVANLSAKHIAVPLLILVTLFILAVCLLVPRALIDNRAGARREQLQQEFPDALDLMVVCVEAGLGLEAAFVRVGLEVHRSHPMISRAFNEVSQEILAGRTRADALRGMADRYDVDSLKSFAALLIQSDQLGSSIAQTLRTFANEMREHRLLRAEEKAMRIPVLLTIPLVACILPVIVVALLLPPILDVAHTLVPALAGRPH